MSTAQTCGCERPGLRAIAPPTALFSFLFQSFFSNRVWEEAQLQQGGLEILGSPPCLSESPSGKTENLQTLGEMRTNASEADTGLRPQEKGPDSVVGSACRGWGCRKRRDHRERWREKENQLLQDQDFFNEDREEMTQLSEMSKKIQRVCNHTEEREEGKGGRRKKLTKN